MSLDYSFGRIKNWKKVCLDSEGQVKPLTEAIIFRTMFVDMGQITEKNYREFYLRCKVVSEVTGKPLIQIKRNKPVEVDFTLDDIRAHIGLSTNVSTKNGMSFWSRWTKSFDKEEGKS